MNDPEDSLAVAAIVHSGRGEADSTLLEFIQLVKDQGKIVRGLIPGPTIDAGNCATRTLQDVHNGTLYPISQNLGKESRACSLDPGALLTAGQVLRQAMHDQADLIVVNRFGVLESEGKGFCDEMLELIANNYPVLTVVSTTYLDAWRKFTGGLATELSPDLQELSNWFAKTPAIS